MFQLRINSPILFVIPLESPKLFETVDEEYTWTVTGIIGAPRGFFIINRASTILNVEAVSEPEYTGGATNPLHPLLKTTQAYSGSGISSSDVNKSTTG